jgi:hypothetical protein
MVPGQSWSPAHRVLIEEACRLADRAAALDRLLQGDAADWVELVEAKGDPERQVLVIDSALSEARQHAMALKQIVGELRQAQKAARFGQPAYGGAQGAAPVPTGGTHAGGIGGIGDLTSRIAARRAEAAG